MSGEKSVKILPLMELNITPPNGYPKLPKWDSTLKYQLKDQSLLDEFENPFCSDLELYHSEEKTEAIDEKKRRLLKFLPKHAPSPSNKMEETKTNSKSHSRLEENSSDIDEGYLKTQVRYEKMSESSDTSVSNCSSSSDHYFDVYCEIKRAKALLLKKIQEDDLNSSESYLFSKDDEISDQPDFMSLESSFLSENKRTSEKYKIDENKELNSLTKKLREYFI